MFAQAKRDQDEYDRMMEEESEAEASDAQRAFAIRRAMEAQGALLKKKLKMQLHAAGYKTGGRVGLFSGDAPRIAYKKFRVR